MPKTAIGVYWIRGDIFDRFFDVQFIRHITTGFRKINKNSLSGTLKSVFLQQRRTSFERLQFQRRAMLMANLKRDLTSCKTSIKHFACSPRKERIVLLTSE